jgi:hypothetical protein
MWLPRFACGGTINQIAVGDDDARPCRFGSGVGSVRRVVADVVDNEPGQAQVVPGSGILSLYHGDKKVGQGRIKTQPGMFSLAGEGLCVGRDSGEPVTGDYPGEHPHVFTGGTIKRVGVDVSGDPTSTWSARPRPCSRGNRSLPCPTIRCRPGRSWPSSR